ncbi:MAG: isoaspartyl peptidase/L-asparaginase family protein [Candidatus Thorarchaeota archaeon]
MKLLGLPAIVVHGGATEFEEEVHEAILKAVRLAARRGLCVMEKGGTALDAVETATWALEDAGLFTAGRGARPNTGGYTELDAMIMDGNRLESGAVMGVRGVTHPISLARYVLERTPNMQFVADGAYQLYQKMIEEGYREESEEGVSLLPPIARGCDTVGCVAVDVWGRIAGASSTSGWTGKLPGRVGDSPIIGAGVYANELAAASCTGRGEQILRITMARMAVHYVEEGMSVPEAAAAIMRVLRERTSGEAGLIMVNKDGEVGLGFDTKHMPVAVIVGDSADVYSSMTPVWPPG